MNDNRNMILAIVLSALVLLGWSFLSEQLVPDRRPADPEGRERQGEAGAAAAASASPSQAPQALRARSAVARLDAARPDRDAEPQRLDQPEGRADRRSRAARTARHDRPKIRRPVPPAVAGRRARRPISPASAGAAQGVAAPDADTVWTASAPTLSPGKPVTLSWTNPAGQRFESDHLGRRPLSLHGPAAGRERSAPAPSRSAPTASPAAPDAIARPVEPGRSTSARSASSTARPTMTSTGRRSTKQGPGGVNSRQSTAAGSASPTNIG